MDHDRTDRWSPEARFTEDLSRHTGAIGNVGAAVHAAANPPDRPRFKRGHHHLTWWNEARALANFGVDPLPEAEALFVIAEIMEALTRTDGGEAVRAYSRTVVRMARVWRSFTEWALRTNAVPYVDLPREPCLRFARDHLGTLADFADAPRVQRVA